MATETLSRLARGYQRTFMQLYGHQEGLDMSEPLDLHASFDVLDDFEDDIRLGRADDDDDEEEEEEDWDEEEEDEEDDYDYDDEDEDEDVDMDDEDEDPYDDEDD